MRTSLLVILLYGCLAGLGNGISAADDKSDYKDGERLSQPAVSASGSYRNMDWDALIPKDWDPMQAIKELNVGNLKDSDPRAMEALSKLKEAWNNAPVESSLRGQRIRIPGFVVPLEHSKQQLVTEFLLVPYFGACIHVPPPPANQVIHVIPANPVKTQGIMDAVWVSGTLEIEHSDSPLGAAGYKMKADVVTPYGKP